MTKDPSNPPKNEIIDIIIGDTKKQQVTAENKLKFAQTISKDNSAQDTSFEALGEDFEGEDDGDSIRFVQKHELDALKKEVDECHRANETLRTFITDTTSDLHSLKTRISDDFSWSRYETDWKTQREENTSIYDRIKEDVKLIHEILVEHEDTEKRDRTLLYQEI